jgi:hypothetical protein
VIVTNPWQYFNTHISNEILNRLCACPLHVSIPLGLIHSYTIVKIDDSMLVIQRR